MLHYYKFILADKCVKMALIEQIYKNTINLSFNYVKNNFFTKQCSALVFDRPILSRANN